MNYIVGTTWYANDAIYCFLSNIKQQLTFHTVSHCHFSFGKYRPIPKVNPQIFSVFSSIRLSPFLLQMSLAKFEMDKVINMGIFVGGALAGSFVATNAEVLKNNIAMLFSPPGVDKEGDEECGQAAEGDDEYEDDD